MQNTAEDETSAIDEIIILTKATIDKGESDISVKKV